MYKAIFILCVTLLVITCASSKETSYERYSVESIIQNARSYIGTKYQYAGSSKKGMDCSGLTNTVFKSLNIALPRSSDAQSKSGRLIKRNDAMKGDLIFFKKKRSIFHVGIVSKVSAGQIWMIHSSTSKGVVEQEVLSNSYWAPKLHIFKRVL